jgi:hypothetical protein
MTTDELNNILDIRLAAVVAELKEKSGLDPMSFSGTVVGFLIKTGIHLAAKEGCPNSTLRSNVNQVIKEAYAKA